MSTPKLKKFFDKIIFFALKTFSESFYNYIMKRKYPKALLFT